MSKAFLPVMAWTVGETNVGETMPDPGNDARALSVNAIRVMTGKVFGDIAGPVVSTELLDMLGLGPTSHVEEYLKQIQAKLDEMQHQITALQTSVAEILNGVTVVQSQLPGIEVQQLLASLTASTNLIRQNFQSYVDCVAALQTGDPAKVAQAGQDLFQLLGLINIGQVASAMTTIQYLFLPQLQEQKGLIELQHDLIRASIVDFAAHPDNYRVATNPPRTDPDGRSRADGLAIPSGSGVFRCAAIVDEGHARADAVLRDSVAATFKAFMTVQTQGLILLNNAWLKSNHESQIVQQVAAVQRVLDGMKAFEQAVVITVDDQVATSLKVSGQRLTGVAASNDIRYDYGYGDVRMQYPLSDDWLMWDVYLDRRLDMMLTPWTYQPATIARLRYDTTQDYPHIFIERSDSEHKYRPEGGEAPRYGGIPQEMTFIRDL